MPRLRNREAAVASADEFGLLSGIWILSCNDKIPEMTYQSLRFRCGLPDNYDVKRIVQTRGELFRVGMPPTRLTKWRQQMLDGNLLPSWIRDIEDTSERRRAIEEIKAEDLFRNQFRIEENAPQTSLEILKWGLEHIERLRKATVESREEKRQIWSAIRLPIVSMVVALTALLSSCFMQTLTLRQQELQKSREVELQSRLKYYEVELKPKLEGYTSLMKSLTQATDDVKRRNARGLNTSLGNAELALDSFEPFFEEDPEKKKRGKQIRETYRNFAEKCRGLIGEKQSPERLSQLQGLLLNVREDLRGQLSELLFQPLPPGLLQH